MQRLSPYLLGPELLWLLLYGLVSILAKANVPPSKSMDNLLHNLYLLIPLVALLVFSLWYFPAVEKDWLLLRVWIAGIIGAHYCLDKGLGAYSEQGAGIGTAYIVGIMIVFCVLVAGSIFVKLRF